MNEIEGLQFLNAGSQATTQGPARDELGQEAFLELMIAQFRNQDPFEPMTNGEFLGQLAQFGTVSGIQELQDSFGGLSQAINSDQALQASNLVGHRVLATSDLGFHSEERPLSGAIELQGSVSQFDVEITDVSGALVRTISLGPQDAGLIHFDWDGITLDGEQAANGVYQVTTRVQRGSSTETLPTLIQAEVESVSLGRDGRGIRLNTFGQGTLLFSQIDRIL